MAGRTDAAWQLARERYILAIAVLIAELARREMRDAGVWIGMLRLDADDIGAVRTHVEEIVALRRRLSRSG